MSLQTFAAAVQADFCKAAGRYGWASRAFYALPAAKSSLIAKLNHKHRSLLLDPQRDIILILDFFCQAELAGSQEELERRLRELPGQLCCPESVCLAQNLQAMMGFCQPACAPAPARLGPGLRKFVLPAALADAEAARASVARLCDEISAFCANPSVSFRFAVSPEICGAIADSLNCSLAASGPFCSLVRKRQAEEERSLLGRACAAQPGAPAACRAL